MCSSENQIDWKFLEHHVINFICYLHSRDNLQILPELNNLFP